MSVREIQYFVSGVNVGDPAHLELLFNKYPQIDVNRNNGELLRTACCKGRREVAQFLVSKGADPSIRNGGYSVLNVQSNVGLQ